MIKNFFNVNAMVMECYDNPPNARGYLEVETQPLAFGLTPLE
jgi:hypothetical protein